MLLQWSFAPRRSAPAEARSLVSDALDGQGAHHDLILLMVSELVTNAVLHTESVADLRLFDLGDQGVRIEVEDRSARLPTTVTAPSAEGGFGLHIIGSFARSWGTSPTMAVAPRTQAGKVVWFEMDPHIGASPEV